MAERLRAFDLRTERYRFESRWILFFILFFSIYILFLCVIFFRRIFKYYYPFFSSIDFFKFQNRLVQFVMLYWYQEYIMLCTQALIFKGRDLAPHRARKIKKKKKKNFYNDMNMMNDIPIDLNHLKMP
jgi:hypothetical protein